MDAQDSSDIAQILRHRRTIHAYLPECPPQSLVLEAIDLARWAPNHRHTEPCRFHLIGDETKQQIIDLNTSIVLENKGPDAAEAKRLRWSEIPGWLAVSCLRTPDDAVRDEEDYAATCCAIHNLTLFLWSRGVGVKWNSGKVTRHADFFALLGLNSDAHRISGLLWYGYPAKIPEQQRKPVEEILMSLP